MSSIVYWTDKKSGRVYAYSSQSYWDKDKKQSRSRRVYLGPVDPVTGEIVKGKRGARKQVRKIYEQTSEDVENEVIKLLKGEVSDLQGEVSRLKGELEELQRKYNQVIRAVKTATKSLSNIPLD